MVAFMLRYLLIMITSLLSNALHAEELPDWLDQGGSEAASSLQTARYGKWFLETAGFRTTHENSSAPEWHGNVGLDGNVSTDIRAGWRATFNMRIDLDSTSSAGISSDDLSLTLRELYASGSLGDWSADFGRINVRDGVAANFNPSDVFRTGSLLARRTENPSRLRESRLGVVGAKLQHGFGGGNFAVMAVPHLGDSGSAHWYDPRWGAVNDGQAQGYAMYTLPRWHGLYSNALIHWLGDGGTTYGLNLSNNFGQAVVANLEFASTRRQRLAALAESSTASPQRYSQLAAGVTYSTETRQSLTFEYDYNGGGLKRDEWNGRWQSLPKTGLQRAFNEASRRQDPVGSHTVMGMLQWDRFLAYNGQLDLLVQFNAVDKSRFIWGEWRYQMPKIEWAVNLGWMNGSDRSQYGAADQRWTLGLRARFYY